MSCAQINPKPQKPTDEANTSTSTMANQSPSPRKGFLKRMLPHSLFGRAVLIMFTPLVLLQLIASHIFFGRHWNAVTSRLTNAVAAEIGMVTERIAPMLQPLSSDLDQVDRSSDLENKMVEQNRAAQVRQILRSAEERFEMVINYLPGQRLDHLSGSPWDSKLAAKLRDYLDHHTGHPSSIHVFVPDEWIEARIQLDSGVLRVFIPMRRLFTSTGFIFFLWLTGSSIVLYGIAIIFLRNQISPIRRLAVAAERFGKGQELTGFKPSGATEVRQAAAAFLIMRDRIRRQITQRTEMLAGVSHDLRTPLTRMKLSLAMMERQTEDVIELKNTVIEMEQMVEGYLAFARGAEGHAVELCDLGSIIEELATACFAPGQCLELSLDRNLTARIQPLNMRRCLRNLMENARRYALHVWIQAQRTEDKIIIQIHDDGPGIALEHREDVFRPFMRLEASRNIETGGVGLGLSIARDIARSHGGELTLEDSTKGSLCAKLCLPV